MAKGPGLYSDIGKKARDLLNRDFQTDQKFTITTYSPTGVAITSSGSKKGDLFLGDVTTQLKNKNITTEFKVDTKSNLFTTITVVEAAPGLKSIVNFRLPDQRSGAFYFVWQYFLLQVFDLLMLLILISFRGLLFQPGGREHNH
ncbi:unnamed protein product [Cuscuta europaea]|uniref:Uncharacterized protein n=1 Tax=Cuscuta europaea TaxID=41803 RepID=A0A9P0Z1G9_CUSEU|nr:unnamed protein product [Cuscuta europaea]